MVVTCNRGSRTTASEETSTREYYGHAYNSSRGSAQKALDDPTIPHPTSARMQKKSKLQKNVELEESSSFPF
jgi:hypothetical protein